VPDLVLDYHRLKVPADHPDGSVTIAKLATPSPPATFAYMSIKGSLDSGWYWDDTHSIVFYATVLADSAIYGLQADGYGPRQDARWRGSAKTLNKSWYEAWIDSVSTTADFLLRKSVAGTITKLATEAVDLGAGTTYPVLFSVSGSSLKGVRYKSDGTTTTLTATDTSLASGYTGYVHKTTGAAMLDYTINIQPPSTPAPPAQAIIELEIEGSGKLEDPHRPMLSKNLVEITSLTGLPDFLYQESKKYQILVSKGFTEDEMRLIFGYVPQHQVDLDSVSWGAFEFHPDRAPTVIITITGDNPYRPGAIERQKARAKRWWRPPRDYSETVELYRQLRRDYPHWLASKHNWCYQVFGYELFDWLQNVDFYYGELVEHRTHYQQLKQVPEGEIWRRLDALESALRGAAGLAGALAAERDRHLAKIREIRKRGW
jgi:hypothetical protein